MKKFKVATKESEDITELYLIKGEDGDISLRARNHNEDERILDITADGKLVTWVLADGRAYSLGIKTGRDGAITE